MSERSLPQPADILERRARLRSPRKQARKAAGRDVIAGRRLADSLPTPQRSPRMRDFARSRTGRHTYRPTRGSRACAPPRRRHLPCCRGAGRQRITSSCRTARSSRSSTLLHAVRPGRCRRDVPRQPGFHIRQTVHLARGRTAIRRPAIPSGDLKASVKDLSGCCPVRPA